MSSRPGSLAFDFDGVLCNGLKEYFQTAWRVYCQFWPLSEESPPSGLAERFYKLRPVVEVGWEMPIVLRAVMQGYSDQDVFSRWPEIRDQLIQAENLDSKAIGQAVDQQRDQWIQTDLESWLDLHDFYPGVLNRLCNLQRDQFPFVIITTKESRFVKRLLERANITLEGDKIFGKDCKRPKPETLKLLQPSLPGPIWFIEDRIAALNAVQADSKLRNVELFLADWGYNIALDRTKAQQSETLHCLSLQQFEQDFDGWCSAPESTSS